MESFEQSQSLRAASELNNAMQIAILSGSRQGTTNKDRFDGSYYLADSDYLYGDQPDMFSTSDYNGNLESMWSVVPGEPGAFVMSESDHVVRSADRNHYGGVENFQIRSLIKTSGGSIEVADDQPASYADAEKEERYTADDDRFRAYTNSYDETVRPTALTVTRRNKMGRMHAVTLTGERAVRAREIMHRRVARNIGTAAIARVSRPLQRIG